MAKLNPIKMLVLSLVFLLGSVCAAQARTSLVSLPSRQHVAVRLGHTGITLVQEKRTLSLKKGVNKIDFSWQNVMIDASSITLTPLSTLDRITILNVSYPPDEATLVWEIYSPADIEEQVMISYLLANIDGVTAYKAIVDPEEQTMELRSFLALRNFSGENFEGVTVYPRLGKPLITSIDHLETKRILVSDPWTIPIQKKYTWDALKMPHDPENTPTAIGIPTRYEFKAGLVQGKARIFQQDNQGSTIFLGEDTAPYTPFGEKTGLAIGDSRDIRVTQRRIETQRTHITRNLDGKIQVYDEIIKDRVIMENLKDTAVTLSLVQTIPGHWEPLDISMAYERTDHKTLIFQVTLAAKEKKTLKLHYQVLNIFARAFSQYNRAKD